MAGGGHIIIRQIAAKLRAEALEKTKEAHGWFGRKWIEICAVFGVHK